MRAIGLSLCAVALGVAGCDSDCDNPSRIDGHYAVWSAVTSDSYTVTGFEDDDSARLQLLHDLFVNGWSEWDLTYVPAKGKFDVTIQNQVFKGSYDPAEDNCNAFGMGFSGMFVTDAGVNHSFTWSGDLSYQGSHVSGVYSYSDTWTAPDGTGSIDFPQGEIRANLRPAGDTGFQ